MIFNKIYYCKIHFILFLFLTYETVKCQDSHQEKQAKYSEASGIATTTALAFMNLFNSCLGTTMSNQKFHIDNLQRYVLRPARTTVGYMPKFTSNRKFFANLLGTTEFKEMLAKDEYEMRSQYVQKMKYCDDAIMDTNTLTDFYDREVDQSKI